MGQRQLISFVRALVYDPDLYERFIVGEFKQIDIREWHPGIACHFLRKSAVGISRDQLKFRIHFDTLFSISFWLSASNSPFW